MLLALHHHHHHYHHRENDALRKLKLHSASPQATFTLLSSSSGQIFKLHRKVRSTLMLNYSVFTSHTKHDRAYRFNPSHLFLLLIIRVCVRLQLFQGYVCSPLDIFAFLQTALNLDGRHFHVSLFHFRYFELSLAKAFQLKKKVFTCLTTSA